MKGLEIAKSFYKEFGEKMLSEQFPDVKERIAAALVGEGSECFGFDDEISRDHDFDAGFCLFITAEDERKFGFKLERAYSKLPKEYMGLKRNMLSPVGGNRKGVIVIEDFYKKHLGADTAPNTLERWLYTPSCSLACASNGEVFSDSLGEFSKIREVLLKGYPEDIRLKKLATHCVFMAQAGQYNFERCIKRGETGAASLSIYEFVRHTVSLIYLLNNKYEPFYKWAFKGLRDLKVLSSLADSLEAILELDNEPVNAKTKLAVIEDISAIVIAELKNQSLTKANCADLQKHAYSLLDGIKDPALRNMHIMDGI